MSLAVDVVRELLPTVPLDRGVSTANTGFLLLDSLPLLTLAPCATTLHLYWERRRYVDFSLFLLGFMLALVYHVLHMHPEGIASAQLLGLSGPTWRGLDILCAQALLARTLGHAVGAQSSLLLSCLSNLVYPASLLVYAHLLADGVLTLGFASKVLLLVLLATLAAKAGLEGFHTLPRYCPHHGKRTLACFAAAFVVFPLPELFPNHYWLCHSVWHLLLAEGYYLLYSQLEGLHLEPGAACMSASQGTDASSRSAGSQEADSADGSSVPRRGWAHTLLQPARHVARFQRRCSRRQAEGELSNKAR